MNVPSRKMRRLIKRTKCLNKNICDVSCDEATERLKVAYKEYKDGRKEANGWRDEFLELLATDRAEFLGTDIEMERKKLINQGQQRMNYHNINRLKEFKEKTMTTKIYVTREGERRAVEDKKEIERECVKENIKKFTQANDTPPMSEEFRKMMGRWGESEVATTVLDGTCVPPEGTDKYLAELLRYMKMPDNISTEGGFWMEVDGEENTRFWRKQKGKTASEETAAGFSEMKAAAEDKDLSTFDAKLRNIPLRYGFSPEAWKEMTDVEILKKAGVWDVEKLQTIIMMHTQFNANNKKLGRNTLRYAEEKRAIAKEQFGSRKHHSCIRAALNKRLTANLMRLRRQAFAICFNDAKSCYDRIVHWICALARRRLGAPKEAVSSMFETIQLSRHKIGTAHGTSKTKYTGRKNNPLQGIGQGNGCGPTLWVAISTPIIAMMVGLGFGLNI